MGPLKVLIWHWGRKGGGPRYTLEIARVLARRSDLQIHLSLSRQSEMYDAFAEIPVAGRFDINTYQTIPEFILGTLKLPWIRRRFAKYLKQEQVDIVLCTMDHLWDTWISRAVHDSGCLYLLTVHDATRHPGEDQGWRRWLLERDICASDGALVLTKSVGASLVQNYKYPSQRVFFSTLGHFGSKQHGNVRALPTERPARLLFFGRILAYKGLDLLLSALPLIRAEFPEVGLDIWGMGDLSPYMQTIEAMPNIRVENRWIAEDEIPFIFQGTDLAVLPYREASQSAVLATAFATGMPCVITPIPGLREQIEEGKTGVVSEGITHSDFANAVMRILRDPILYQRLSAGCIEATQSTLSWSTIGSSVAEAVHSLHKMGRRLRLPAVANNS